MLEIINNTPFDSDAWPGFWMWAEGNSSAFEVAQFSRRIPKEQSSNLFSKLHISADNRYKLYLDGKFIGLGPQRGNLENWYFDTYNLQPEISENDHVLTVIAWHDRDTAPSAQISARPALLIAEETSAGQIISPISNWKCRHLQHNNTLAVPEEAICAGPGYDMTGITFDELTPNEENFEQNFNPVMPLGRARNHRSGNPALLLPWKLRPRTIPALLAKENPIGKCRRLITDIEISKDQIDNLTLSIDPRNDKTISIPPNSNCRFLIDNDFLTTGYPIIRLSNGRNSKIKLTYQEALQFEQDNIRSKKNRNTVEDGMLIGVIDEFCPDGRDNLIFEPFCYRCWRYIEFEISTSDKPLHIHQLKYRSTGYPFELKAEFGADAWFNRLVEPGFRTLCLCANEIFMDCPYYERLQYMGDTRIDLLLTYILSGDDRLPRQAIEAFGQSRLANGLTLSQYPSRFPQLIPTFSLLHIAVLNDFLMWQGDKVFINKQVEVVDSILRAFTKFINKEGFIGKLPPWPFIDWTPKWPNGSPAGTEEGNSFMVNFLYLYVIQNAAKLYETLGYLSQAKQTFQQSLSIQTLLREKAFDKSKQLFIDEPSGKNMSQHTNILAILTDTCLGLIDGQTLLTKILDDKNMAKASYYFMHYLFEAMFHVKRADLIWPALKPWHTMLDNGLSTFAEKPEPTRSDCHAWSSHPLYHFFASVIGVRPKAPGCSKISIKPAPRTRGVLEVPAVLTGAFITPLGKCHIRIEDSEQGWQIHTKLPDGIELEPEEKP